MKNANNPSRFANVCACALTCLLYIFAFPLSSPSHDINIFVVEYINCQRLKFITEQRIHLNEATNSCLLSVAFFFLPFQVFKSNSFRYICAEGINIVNAMYCSTVSPFAYVHTMYYALSLWHTTILSGLYFSHNSDK